MNRKNRAFSDEENLDNWHYLKQTIEKTLPYASKLHLILIKLGNVYINMNILEVCRCNENSKIHEGNKSCVNNIEPGNCY